MEEGKYYKKICYLLFFVGAIFLGLRGFDYLRCKLVFPGSAYGEKDWALCVEKLVEKNKMLAQKGQKISVFDIPPRFSPKRSGAFSLKGYVLYQPLTGLPYFLESNKKKANPKKCLVLSFKGNAQRSFFTYEKKGKVMLDAHLSSFSDFLMGKKKTQSYDVVEVDYPGSGGSGGQLRNDQDFEDYLCQVLNFLMGPIDNPTYQEVLLVGRSIGNVGAIAASAMISKKWKNKVAVKGLIMFAPFASLRDANFFSSLFYWALSFHFDNLKGLEKIYKKIPLVLFHGRADSVIDYEKNAKKIYNACLQWGSKKERKRHLCFCPLDNDDHNSFRISPYMRSAFAWIEEWHRRKRGDKK